MRDRSDAYGGFEMDTTLASPGQRHRYPNEPLSSVYGMANPYSPPRETSVQATSVRKWVVVITSLVATVPVGLAIDLLLFDIESIRINDETACFWAASSVLGSLICSSVAAWLTTAKLSWYHFWLTYQLGWLMYFMIGIGQPYNLVTAVLYSWTPFVVPVIVAVLAPFFNSSRSQTMAPDAGG